MKEWSSQGSSENEKSKLVAAEQMSGQVAMTGDDRGRKPEGALFAGKRASHLGGLADQEGRHVRGHDRAQMIRPDDDQDVRTLGSEQRPEPGEVCSDPREIRGDRFLQRFPKERSVRDPEG
jgi:hypothetical protein